MAAKKKSVSKKNAPKTRTASKKAFAKKAPAKAAKPAEAAKLAKPAKAANPAKPVKAPPKAAKSPAKPAKATGKPQVTKPSAGKPTQREKAAKPQKSPIMKAVEAAPAETATRLIDADVDRAAPAFELRDEKGETVSSTELAGKPYLIYFYPKDDTPGCTREACDMRDNFGRFGARGIRVLGVSPDSSQSHAKFGKKYGLPFTLLADPDKTLATAYGVWGEKNNYGKKYMGIIRSTFLVGSDGLIKKSYRGVKVDGHVSAILEDAAALL